MADGNEWFSEIAGDNKDFAETLKAYETPEKFLESHIALTKRDWRTDIAGEDDKFKSTLARFASPQDFGKSYREAQATIRSGSVKSVPKADATEDELKVYREANGIPADPKGYLENLPDGLVVGDDDKEIIGEVMDVLHKNHIPPSVGHGLVKWYNGFAEREQAARAEMDGEHSKAAADELKGEWGQDYRANVNMIGALLESTFGKEAKEQMLNGRYGDGRAFMNDPNVLRGLAQIARQVMDPSHGLIPAGTGNAQQTLDDEIKEHEKFMREKRDEYNKDTKRQERLRYLYDLQLKQGKAA